MTEQLNWTDVDHLGENETGPTQQRESQRKGKEAIAEEGENYSIVRSNQRKKLKMALDSEAGMTR